jgi:CRISPR/Cas system-associated exonuclease Cas4 (RecB family)
MQAFNVLVSASAAERLAEARRFVASHQAGVRVLIVGASRGAADDLAREVSVALPATFGIQRLTLTQLAARTAIVALAERGVTPSTWLGAEAVAARAVFDTIGADALRYFAPVADRPGFPRALARTLQELRLAGVADSALARVPLAGGDLAVLLDRFDACFDAASSADRATLLRTAARLLRDRSEADAVLLLDVPLDHAAERELVEALLAGASSVLATVPAGDTSARDTFKQLGAAIAERDAAPGDDLGCLRRFLFTTAEPPERVLDGSLEFFSAPGEGRECVEIARRILKEARRGTRFDEMAILVRSPHSYFGLIEHALGRADVPAWFDRGTRRPHPAGRAFLALLACAGERLSASRFAEYLSLGQVPRISPGQSSADGQAWAASQDEVFGRSADVPEDELEQESRHADAEPFDADDPIGAGTLRAPWRWEKLLVEAAVIGRDATRWRRRLDGTAAELRLQIQESERDGTDAPRVQILGQTLDELQRLHDFALPIVEEMAAWPPQAPWGQWLDLLERIAPRVLRTPAYVLRVLADLRPMANVGPIDLDEVRRVLTERLLMLETEPPSRRFGRVLVGTPLQARGRSFRVVFVPGLAERLFPQKPREDPLLLDDRRRDLDRSLPLQHQRLAAERLLLQLAAGAATERLYVSYPRIELSESRARVPSFYALDVMRAATGRVPDHELLEERARIAGNATLAWPAPPRPEDAIDDQEHDLAVLRLLLDQEPGTVKGHAHYLLKLNDSLRRSVIDRWARGDRRWSPNDGLIRVTNSTRAALAAQRLDARSYSLSALQRFAACPYQFLLAAVYRLQPMERPESLQRLDPLTRGSLVHEIQATFFRALDRQGALPVTAATLDEARRRLDAVIDDVADRQHDELVPAVERVWADEIASIRRDLHAWLEIIAREGEEWQPKYFELAFGQVPGERDPHSVEQSVAIEGRYLLRGAVDLIEEHRQTKLLRVTDHKTGRKPERIDRVILGGGEVLQPVLYALAVERALGRPVRSGRLFYCTAAGSFHPHEIPLNDVTRQGGLEVLQVIDRAIELGFLAAAPSEEACSRCDFRPVCGPHVFRRVSRKPQDSLADLLALREKP